MTYLHNITTFQRVRGRIAANLYLRGKAKPDSLKGAFRRGFYQELLKAYLKESE